MTLFSHRKGLKKVRTAVQVDSIDGTLRNRLWNVFKTSYLDNIHFPAFLTAFGQFMRTFWDNYLKATFDTMPTGTSSIYTTIMKYFFNCEWYEVYDFLEFFVNNFPIKTANDRFISACNNVLEQDLSAYRFVGGQITQITSEDEIVEIEEALETPLKPVKAHLEKSLELLSDRKSPDYRNSIKESISAVEAICRIIAKDEKATLGKALDLIEEKVGLHGALKNAFSNLYGYTSSAEGIRHSLLDESTLSFEDAKFMLVSCSAFINYLISKAEKARIKL